NFIISCTIGCPDICRRTNGEQSRFRRGTRDCRIGLSRAWIAALSSILSRRFHFQSSGRLWNRYVPYALPRCIRFSYGARTLQIEVGRPRPIRLLLYAAFCNIGWRPLGLIEESPYGNASIS